MFKSTDKVLITGSSGFVGRNLLNNLHKNHPCKLVALIHENYPAHEYADVKYTLADLTDPKDCKRVVREVDYIFHCAANTSGAAVMQDSPLEHVTANILMNLHLFEAAYNAGVKKILWISSGAIYPLSDHPMKEDEAFTGEPYEKYFAVAHMKRYTETLAELFSSRLQRKLPIIVIRPSNIYGPYDKFDLVKGHVTASLIKKVINKMDPLEIWGTGEEIRDLIYIDDFIAGLLLAFEKLDNYNPVNIGSGIGYSVVQILSTLLLLEDFHPELIYNKNKPTTIPKVLLDVTKAKQLLGFKASTSLEVGLKRTIEWYRRTYGNLKNAV